MIGHLVVPSSDILKEEFIMALDCQTHVIRATDVVDYSGIVKTGYPYQAMQSEPFIGIKVLCRDTKANTFPAPAQRIAQLDTFLATPNMTGATPLYGTGCCVRETKYSVMQDGFWIITLPVPRSQMNVQINNLVKVITMFKQLFGFQQLGYIEINVSGKCPINGLEMCLSGLNIPDSYMQFSEQPDNSPYKVGHVERINDNFICLRSRWRMNPSDPALYSNISVIAQLISSIYH